MSRAKYHRAIADALDVLRSRHGGAVSLGTAALSRVLAWTLDSTFVDARLEELVMDAPTRAVAVALLLGRLEY